MLSLCTPQYLAFSSGMHQEHAALSVLNLLISVRHQSALKLHSRSHSKTHRSNRGSSILTLAVKENVIAWYRQRSGLQGHGRLGPAADLRPCTTAGGGLSPTAFQAGSFPGSCPSTFISPHSQQA